MIDEVNILKIHTYIKDYYILDVMHVGRDAIVYRAEDMKYNRDVLIHEYFPECIAKRHYEGEGVYTVYVHPTQGELFLAKKTEFEDVYNTLKMLNDPSIPTVYELIESSGTLLVSTKYKVNTTTLRYHLNNSTKMFFEQRVGMIALSIARAFVRLHQDKLQVYLLNPETILIDNKTKEPILAYTEYMSFNEQAIQSSIYELGILLYEIMDKESFKDGEPLQPLKPNKVYSAALCGLVNRMISNDASKQLKTFQELRALLESYEATPEQCEPIVCERTETKLSSFVSLTSILLVIFSIYFLVSQERMDVKSINWFDSMRYHLIAYYGDVKGQSALGQMYEKGYYVDVDIKESIVWYKKAAQQGDVDAQLSLAYIYKNVEGVKDDKAALEIFLQLARAGNLYAQKKLGYSYIKGDGTSQDYKQAMYWFEKAQDQGDAYSCGAIGWMYRSGYGVTKDLKKALNWFKEGLDRNDTYSKEEFVKLEKKIKELDEISLREKNVREYRLGYQYEKGSKGYKNDEWAVKHYLTSAKLGNTKAEFRLAQLYERSEQIPRDYSSALYWYKQAAKHGDILAYYRVSELYRAGQGVKKDDKLALEWCKEAAERGLGVAQSILGSSYEFGLGTDVRYDKARYWYELAIKSGYENAVGRLEGLNQKIQAKNKIVIINRKQQKKEKQQKFLSTNNSNTSSVNVRACTSCHGKNFEYRALGKSAIVANMTSHQIATALKGYKSGRYGGAMKVLMRGQVAKYSDADLEAFSKTIGR